VDQRATGVGRPPSRRPENVAALIRRPSRRSDGPSGFRSLSRDPRSVAHRRTVGPGRRQARKVVPIGRRRCAHRVPRGVTVQGGAGRVWQPVGDARTLVTWRVPRYDKRTARDGRPTRAWAVGSSEEPLSVGSRPFEGLLSSSVTTAKGRRAPDVGTSPVAAGHLRSPERSSGRDEQPGASRPRFLRRGLAEAKHWRSWEPWGRDAAQNHGPPFRNRRTRVFGVQSGIDGLWTSTVVKGPQGEPRWT
jgi:hypothetical protein